MESDTVCIFNTNDARETARFPNSCKAHALAFGLDASTLWLACQDRTLRTLDPRNRKRKLERDNFPAEVLRITAHRTLLAIKADGVAVWDVYRGIGRGAFAVASRSSLEEQGVAVFGHGLAVSAGTQSAVYELATGARIHDFDGRNVRALAAPTLMAGFVFVATRSESEGRARGSVFRWPPVGRELVGSSFNPPGFVPGWDPQMHPRPD